MEHIGVDLGTGSIKLIVVSEDGEVRNAGASYPVLSPKPGYSETSADEWLRAFRACLSELEPFEENVTIGFSGQMHGIIPVAEGEALRSAILWSDTRAGALLDRIPKDQKILSRIMNVPSAGMGLLSILWLKENEPEIYNKAEYFLSPKDYIRYYLTGQPLTEPTDAGATLMYDQMEGAWHTGLLEALGVDSSKLPPVAGSFEEAAPVIPGRAKQLGLPAASVIRVGGADTACALLGNGINSSGCIQLSIGTGCQIAEYREELPDYSPSLNCYPAAGGGWYIISAHLNGGTFLEWLRSTFKFEWTDIYRELDSRPLEDWISELDGLTFLPYIYGERSPFMDPDLSGSLNGLRFSHKRIHIILAAMLGTLFAVRIGMETFGDNPVLAAGGSFKYPFWAVLTATVLRRSISLSARMDASAWGAALAGAGKESSFFKRFFKTETVTQVKPCEPAVADMDRLYLKFKENLPY